TANRFSVAGQYMYINGELRHEENTCDVLAPQKSSGTLNDYQQNVYKAYDCDNYVTPEEGQHVYRMSTAFGEPQLLIRDARDASVSPDGKWLFYALPVRDRGDGWAGEKFFIRNLRTGNDSPIRLVATLHNARWSPDSKRLAVNFSADNGAEID